MKYDIQQLRLKMFFIVISLMFLSAQLWAQGSCGMTNPKFTIQSGNSSCIDMDIDDVPLKTIRITIHVFQKDDGSENIPDNSTGRGWILNSVMGTVNSDMANLAMMNLPTSSPYFSDSKIRYELVKIHFWKDSVLWSKGSRFKPSHGQALYNFVMSQNIQYKNSSVHIMIPGNYTSDGYNSGGQACGFGCNDWAMLEDTYHWYQNSNHWFPANTIRHELGHNFNLYHSWYSDYCSDTPSNSNCWNGSNCSNNMMDYNASQSAITQCQLSRMHEWLESNSSVVKSGLPTYALSGQISWTGGSKSLVNLNFLPVSEFEVSINAPGASSYTWTKTYGDGTWSN